MQFSRHARKIVASQISVRGVPKIYALLYMRAQNYASHVDVAGCRGHACGTIFPYAIHGNSNYTDLLPIVYQLANHSTNFIIHNVNMICDDSYQLPQDALGHSAVFRYSISRQTSIIKAKN